MNNNNLRRQPSLSAVNHESVTFVWFDSDDPANGNLAGPLRAINDQVQIFTHLSSCLAFLQSSPTLKIFFVTSSVDSELLAKVQQCSTVEAMAVLHPSAEGVKGDLAKLVGVFRQQEELLHVLKDVLEIFEQVQLETFAFEEEKVFLWSQLCKEEINNRKLRTKKSNFVETTRSYYHDNGRILSSIDEFDKTYRPNEVLSWCFRSPYPSRLLHHALRFHQTDSIRLCHFLLIDAAHRFQQHPKCKGTDQVYRGMKLSEKLLEQFEAHVGRCLSTSGFFPCTKSRSQALTLASPSNYRPDLCPVLFKIDCDASAVCIELPSKQSVFELCTVFRIAYVNRGAMSVIKMRTDNEVGRKLVASYLEQNKEKTLQTLLDDLLRPPTPPLEVKPVLISAEESQAEKHIDEGNVDLALVAYHRLQPVTPRILNAIGRLCAEKKGDYDYALQCHSRALKMQEEAKEDLTETLTHLGNVHQHRQELDKALGCHRHALALRQKRRSVDRAAVASNLIGIAKVHWTRQEYSQAIDHCEQAVTLQESLDPIDETRLATTLAMLGNIQHDHGQDTLPLESCRKALSLRERTTVPGDSTVLAELLHHLGTIQFHLEHFSDAQQSYERALQIYRRTLPREHPDRLAVEDDLRRVKNVSPTKT